MSVALTQIRQRMGRELGVITIIPNAYFDAAAAGSITSANILRDAYKAAGDYQQDRVVIFRPGAASAADYIRYAGLLTPTSGLLAHTGANYADTTVGSEIVELWKWGVRPDLEVIDALNRVLEFEFASTRIMISHIGNADGDMMLATDTNWTDVGTPTTSAKATTAGVTPLGMRSYQLVGDATNEGTRHAGIRLRQSGLVSAFTIASAETGTASFQLRDSTNSADVGTAVTSSERRPTLMVQQNVSVPSTCKLATVSMLGTTNPSNVYWNQLAIYNMESNKLVLPTSVTNGFMVTAVYQARPRYVSNTAGCYDAEGLEYIPLEKGKDYRLIFNNYDAEPYAIWVNDTSWFNWPLVADIRKPASDLTTFAADETATTAAEPHTLYPRFKIELLKTVYPGKMPEPMRREKLAEAEQELARALAVRPIESAAPKLPFYRPVNSVY